VAIGAQHDARAGGGRPHGRAGASLRAAGGAEARWKRRLGRSSRCMRG
jgi:hypothetical protein